MFLNLPKTILEVMFLGDDDVERIDAEIVGRVQALYRIVEK